MKKYIQLHQTQKFAIAIPVLFLLSCATSRFVSGFRFSPEYRWIYEYVGVAALFLSVLLVIFSLVNSISILLNLKMKPIPKSYGFY